MNRQRENEPFPNWDNSGWDYPVCLLDAILLWSPKFARQLDQLKSRSSEEITMRAQRRQPVRDADRTAGGAPEAADEFVDSEIPGSLLDDLARFIRECDIRDGDARIVNAHELAGRLIIEMTRRGESYILQYRPPTTGGGLLPDYRGVCDAHHDALGPCDFDLQNSLIRSPGGSWLPGRIIGGACAEADRIHAARSAREKRDSAANTAWLARLEKPFRERDLFSVFEIAEHLTRKSVAEPDVEKHDYVVLDLDVGINRGDFDLSGESEIVVKVAEPPYFRPLVEQTY